MLAWMAQRRASSGIALRHSVDMVRVTMEFFEEAVPLLARDEEQRTLAKGLIGEFVDQGLQFGRILAGSLRIRDE